MKFWLEMFFVFFADMLLDVFAVRYNISITNKRAAAAAFWSVLIALDAGLSTIVFVDNYYTLISGALGAAVGTFFTVKYAKREKAEDDAG